MQISVSELEEVRNSYAELGRKLERERIIKLLARLYPDVDWDLALAKGGNK